MKTTIFIFIVSLMLTFSSVFFIGENEHEGNENLLAPYDHMMLQRSWPDATFDIDAFRQAMEKAKQGIAMNKTAPAGFSADWVSQGPTNIGGRINTLAIDPTDTSIIYIGSANGGIFKTTNAGKTWKPIFDDHSYLGISYLLIDPKNHNTIYVATGDPNISIMPVIGDGIYRSNDGGKTWVHLGPSQGKIVSKILLHPDSSNVLFAACMGNPFSRDASRGLYKSSDSGKTWKQILFIDKQTGVIDAVIDPSDSKVIYASGWTRIRTNRESTLISSANKIYKTTDGGANWSALSNGLPSYNVSRIGIAMSPKHSKSLYSVIVDSAEELDGIYKSIDAGKSWNKMTLNGLDTPIMGHFGWYFGKIYIDPQNDSEIYVGGVDLWHYTATSQTWNQITSTWYTDLHADKHDLQWISNDHFLLATDGGVYNVNISDPFSDYRRIDKIPNTQFYHTAINTNDYSNYYGGAQDNGTSFGNSGTSDSWQRYGGGDGFRPAFDPTDPDIFYAESQNGFVVEINASAGKKLLFSNKNNDKCNWDMPYMVDKFNPSIIYAGTDKIYSNSVNFKYNFSAISADLTDGNIYGAMFHNMSSMDQSPISKRIFMAGTSDGNVWKSTDGGINWDSITTGLPNRYITSVLASPMDTNVFYVTHSGYKYDETIPHVHRSKNQGKTWTDISGDMPPVGVNDIWVCPSNDSFIFIATDAGVYGTTNAGQNWNRLGLNMPILPVMDIEFNPGTSELVAATFARSMMTYPMDSILKQAHYTAITKKETALTVSVFPNPVLDMINIKMGNGSPYRTTHIEILNMEGKTMGAPVNTSSTNIGISASGFPSGVYMLRISSGKQTSTIKVLKI